jgi:hypothetical protein
MIFRMNPYFIGTAVKKESDRIPEGFVNCDAPNEPIP